MGRTQTHGGIVAILLALNVLLALAVRSLPLASAFPGDGSVLLEFADGSYHARRALFSFVNFPSILFFDPYLNHPDGSPVPWPPLYDLALAMVARLFGDSLAVFERTAAWASPILGALTVLPVYAAGRSVGGPGLALGAGGLYALLWAGAFQATVGNPDHHAATAFLGATLLAVTMTLVHPDTRGRHRVMLWFGWPVARAALLLSWGGSLLYLGLAEGTALLAAAIGGRRDLFVGQAVGCLLAAALVTPWILAAGTPPLGGAFSTFALSWFHVAALLAVAAVAGGMAVLEAVRPSRTIAGRALRVVALALAILGLLISFPGVRDALAPSLAFLAKQDAWASSALIESRSLFGGAIPGAQVQRPPASHFYGWLAYLLPLAPLAAVLRGRERRHREPALCLSVWVVILGSLAIGEIRFSGDFAPSASLSFAVLLAALGAFGARRLRRTQPAMGIVAVLAGAVLLWPSIAYVHAPMLREAIDHLRAPNPTRLWRAELGSLVQFARSVREFTPETAGFFDPSVRPEYGILAAPGLGHVLHYVARRATPVDNFGPYLDAHKLAAVRRFFASTSESEAVEIATELGARYVVTAAYGRGRLEESLHYGDGMPGLFGTFNRRFRLITEGPESGQPLFPVGSVWKTIGLVPYKLFEIVEGAVIEVHTNPHGLTVVELPLVTRIGRRFDYRATAHADLDGVARFRVPYPTETDAPTRAEGAYRVHVGDAEFRLHVSEADVRTGATLPAVWGQ